MDKAVREFELIEKTNSCNELRVKNAMDEFNLINKKLSYKVKLKVQSYSPNFSVSHEVLAFDFEFYLENTYCIYSKICIVYILDVL